MVEGKETRSKTLKRGRKTMTANKCEWHEGETAITQKRSLYEKLLQVEIAQIL